MAGHSKWAQIKRQKGAADVKRGQAFSKLANGITVAARNGADPSMNFQLRIAIDKAKAANMPKDNIERAIERAKGVGGAGLEEVMFEAYGPGGTAFLIETATDNRNRTIGEIRATLNKLGGKLAESGSVSYLFKKRGQIVIPLNNNAETVELSAIEANASDIELLDNEAFIYTEPTELEAVRRKLADQGLESQEVTFEWQPLTAVLLNDKETAQKVIRLSEALEDLDDVSRVAGNFDIPEDLVE